MKRIDSSYKLIELLSGRRSSADAVVNVATENVRLWARDAWVHKKFVWECKRDFVKAVESETGRL